MGLESGNYIADLNPANPLGTDQKSTLDDHQRLMKKAMRQSFFGFTGAVLGGGTDAGAADAYVLTPATPLPSYTANMLLVPKISATNLTTAPTVNISGLGAKAIKDCVGNPLVAGDLPAGCYAPMVYDGTAFRLLGVTKSYVDQKAFSSALPNQPGGAAPYYLDSTLGIASWKAVVPVQILRSARTSNTAIAAADRASLIDITSGTFTQTFAAAATLGSGWYCYLGNSGTGDITLDPSGAETIDGMASFVMYPGELRLVLCDGTALITRVLKGFSKTFTSTGPFVKPPGYEYVEGELWNGGSSGGVTQAGSSARAGGGGGGCFPFKLPLSIFSSTETVLIGAGGLPVSSTGEADGNLGGNSSIGSILIMPTTNSGNYNRGSSMTVNVSTSPTGFESALESNGTVSPSIYGGGTAVAAFGTNGSSIFGGGAGGSITNGGVVAPGTSKVGGNGGAAGVGANASAGAVPGGGGGALNANSTGATYTSGAGARGEVRIRGIQ